MNPIYRTRNLEIWLDLDPFYGEQVLVRRKNHNNEPEWYGEGVVPVGRAHDMYERQRALKIPKKKTKSASGKR